MIINFERLPDYQYWTDACALA